MKYLIVCFKIIFTFNVMAMEPIQSKTEIQKKISAAFKTFGLSAENCVIETEKTYWPEKYPDKTVHRWDGGPRCVHLHEDILCNPYLTEFATHCIAAANKNGHRNKGIFLFFASMGAAIIASASFSAYIIFQSLEPSQFPIPIENQLFYSVKVIGAMFGSVIPLTYVATSNRIPKMLDHAISHHLDSAAFAQACQKLIENNNLKPIATYYAYAKLIKHRPLSRKDQICIIQWALKNHNFNITSARTNYNLVKAHIWKDNNLICRGKYSIPVTRQPEVNFADFDTSAKLIMPFINA